MDDQEWWVNAVKGAIREKDLKICGRIGSFTPSTALLNQRLDTFSRPRMLTEYEIKLLRQCKKEIGEAVRKKFKEQSL